MICSMEDCDRTTVARGLCEKHYRRWQKYGDPSVTAIIVGDDHLRFWSKVDLDGPNGCWLWTPPLRKDGYAQFRLPAGYVLAHRWAWIEAHGPVPDGLELDHLCRVRHCVRPSHLEPVTNVVNSLRSSSPAAENARKTHCKHGHEFTPENIYRQPSRPGTRSCRTCLELRNRQRSTNLIGAN